MTEWQFISLFLSAMLLGFILAYMVHRWIRWRVWSRKKAISNQPIGHITKIWEDALGVYAEGEITDPDGSIRKIIGCDPKIKE